MPATILCCFAHPDDESFGHAGILCRAVAEGNRVVVITATPGDAGYLPPEAASAGLTQTEIRTAELRRACDVIGVHRLELLDYHDGGLADVPIEDLVARLRAVADEERPSTILTFGPMGITGHPDHKAINRATTVLFYELERAGTAKALFFQALPGEAAATLALRGVEAHPNVSVDVTGFVDQRIEALACHGSQPDAVEQVERLRAERPSLEYLYRAYPARQLTEAIDRLGPPLTIGPIA